MLSDQLKNYFTTWIEQQKQRTASSFPPGLQALQAKAWEFFQTAPFPTSKQENYRYFPWLRLAATLLPPREHTAKQATPFSPLLTPSFDAYQVAIYYTGQQIRIQHSAPLPFTISIAPFTAPACTDFLAAVGRYSLFDSDALVALQTAAFQEGLVLKVTAGSKIDKPLVLVHHLLSDKTGPFFPRRLYLLEESCRLQLLEQFYGPLPHTPSLGVTEIVLEARAHLDYVQVQEGGERDSVELNYNYVHQEAASCFNQLNLMKSKGVLRNYLSLKLNGAKAAARLHGGYLAEAGGHISNHTNLMHAVAYTSSQELYKGLVDQQAQAVFGGCIIVAPQAQKTEANQIHHTWLLSPTAKVRSQPQLKIWADDVRCSHGATTAPPPEKELLYMSARGLAKEEAKRLLLQTFFDELFSSSSLKGAPTYFSTWLQEAVTCSLIKS